MLEKNLYLVYPDEQIVFVKSKEDILVDKVPSLINFQIKSTEHIDFSSDLLQEIATMFPKTKINCQLFNSENDIVDTFDWRVKNAFIGVTESLKSLSKCTRLKVCCVIVKNDRIISTGLNGTPRGFRNCSDVFTEAERAKDTYYNAHHLFSEKYEVHAEQNAILELGHNTSIDSYKNLELYCSTCPCPNCAKLIAQAGIKKVYYANDYDRLPEGEKSLQEFGISVYKI
jgi:dCMP deaminase